MKKHKPLLLSLLAAITITGFIFIFSCQKIELKREIKVTTNTVNNITTTTATARGNIIDLGEGIIQYGFCWSTSQNPTINNYKTKKGAIYSTASYTSNLSGLSSNTKYYVRAYATDINGTVYGNQVSFNTYQGTVSDYDGNNYNTAQIGNQIWMKENLKTTHYADGTALIDGTAAGDISGDYTTKYYFAYDNNETNVATYGRLYTWAAIMNGAASSETIPSSVQGICPDGWHVPSDAEWTELTDYLGGESVAGGKMKEVGTTHWNSPNTGATNESGFFALPGSYRNYSGNFENIGYTADFWSSTEYSSNFFAWGRKLSCDLESVFHTASTKSYGYSVRCVRN
ncbi:MAG: fibrobacter succinogenes major paralogous domain-containing protein [Bacteroidales bacterium]|nr:fibrobacter succinogenes major paralogous domain-containing protein [Bacteroidales bacterium]